MSFAAMKKNRQSQIDKLSGELSKLNQSTPRDDDGFWKPEVDKSGNGSAIIRFLPAPNGEDVPFVRIWDHGFQGPGGWFIEKSLTTLGEKCPVSEYNSMLWNSGTEADKTFVRQKTKRRLSFVSNIYVVKDPSNPDNEGQVFLYKYGKKIFDKLQDQMTPEFDDETPVNPFDLWDGANFRLKIRKVEGYRNYESLSLIRQQLCWMMMRSSRRFGTVRSHCLILSIQSTSNHMMNSRVNYIVYLLLMVEVLLTLLQLMSFLSLNLRSNVKLNRLLKRHRLGMRLLVIAAMKRMDYLSSNSLLKTSNGKGLLRQPFFIHVHKQTFQTHLFSFSLLLIEL